MSELVSHVAHAERAASGAARGGGDAHTWSGTWTAHLGRDGAQSHIPANSHARYMPVMDSRMLMGVISLYDVAKAVVDSQNFENKMLKAYIRDWPADAEQSAD